MVPAETEVVLEVQIVNAAAGVTTKLCLKKMDLAWLDSAALFCQRVNQGFNVTKSWTDFLYALFRTLILLTHSALANTCG